MAKPLLSIADLNASAKSEFAYEFEYINEHQEPTGFFISVIGTQSQSVKKATFARIDKQKRKNKLLEKAGKNAEITPFEDDVDDIIKTVASTIVGWRGIVEPYDSELAFTICKNNDLIFAQVKEASENLANFTKAK
jgi:hypothetical protein